MFQAFCLLSMLFFVYAPVSAQKWMKRGSEFSFKVGYMPAVWHVSEYGKYFYGDRFTNAGVTADFVYMYRFNRYMSLGTGLSATFSRNENMCYVPVHVKCNFLHREKFSMYAAMSGTYDFVKVLSNLGGWDAAEVVVNGEKKYISGSKGVKFVYLSPSVGFDIPLGRGALITELRGNFNLGLEHSISVAIGYTF